MKPSTVEPGQVWVLEDASGEDLRPGGVYLVTRLIVLESCKRFRQASWTTQAFGLALDDPNPAYPAHEECIDFVENLLHDGERMFPGSADRWRFVP